VPTPPTPVLADDEDLEPLPVLDGDEDEVEPLVEDLADDEIPRDDADPYDDSTGEGDPVPELDAAHEDESGWLLDAEDAETLDVGTADIAGDERENLLEGTEEPGVGDEDYGLDVHEHESATDGGEEGPSADDEDLREEDLPRLDADDQGEPDDADFVEPGFGEVVSPQPKWADAPWERAGAPLRVAAMRSLACAPGGVLAGGVGVVRVDLEGGSIQPAAKGLAGGEVTRVLVERVEPQERPGSPSLSPRAGLVVATTERGGVFVSLDGGETFGDVNGWRALVRPEEGASGLEVVLVRGELWGRTMQGVLLCSRDLGVTWEKAPVDGFVVALAVDPGLAPSGTLVVLVRGVRGAELLRWTDAGFDSSPLPASVGAHSLTRALLVTWGAAVAIATEGRPVERTIDGVHWSPLEETEGATAVAFLDAHGTLALGLFAEDDERSLLARAAPDGEVRLVAEVDGERAQTDGITALAWDQARGVLWASGAFGVTAFAQRPPLS
jgi:hypothetical protein